MIITALIDLIPLLMASACVVIVAWDHRLWTQSGRRYWPMWALWGPVVAYAVALVYGVGIERVTVDSVLAECVWVGVALAGLGGGVVWRRWRSPSRSPRRSSRSTAVARVVRRGVMKRGG